MDRLIMDDVTRKLYSRTVGFLADGKEPSVLENYKVARNRRYRNEETKEWYDEYRKLRSRVDNLREELKSTGKNISVTDSLFHHLIWGQNGDDNWVSGAGIFDSAKLTSQEFEKLQQHNGFVRSLTEVIKTPTLENFKIHVQGWKSAIPNSNKRLRMYRVFAACTYDVSTTVSPGPFCTVFDLFHKYDLINPYPQARARESTLNEVRWYNENVHLREELQRIFKNEDIALLWIFVWEIFQLDSKGLLSGLMSEILPE